MSDAAEIESKFAVTDFAPVRLALTAAGGERLSRRFEENVVFDTPDGRLRREDILLRLRRDGRGRVTLKLPAALADNPGIKIRREIETVVEDPAALEAILTHLGYVPSLRYEKVRETWRLDAVLVCLDQLPFGLFLEIEGPARSIAAAAARLGLSMDDAMAKTYHALYQDHLAACGLPPADSFVFAPETRQALLTNLPDS